MLEEYGRANVSERPYYSAVEPAEVQTTTKLYWLDLDTCLSSTTGRGLSRALIRLKAYPGGTRCYRRPDFRPTPQGVRFAIVRGEFAKTARSATEGFMRTGERA